MNELLESQFQIFFEQFTEFSKRATEHWPITEESENLYEDTDINYHFTPIITEEELSDINNKTIIDSFFSLYKNPEAIFSCGPKKTDEEQIRNQIRKQNYLREVLIRDRFDICTFLLLGHRKTGKKITLSGCVVHYFPASRSLLIESIIMADNLLGSGRKTRIGSVNQLNNINKKIQHQYEKDQQKVLGWLLTYRENQKARNKAGFYELINRVENIIVKVRINRDDANLIKLPSDAVLSVFHETLNPVMAFQGLDNPTNEERKQALFLQNKSVKTLLAFHQIEARFLKFAYRHPHQKKIVTEFTKNREYLLLTFPQIPKTKNYLTLEAGIIMAFIIDYYSHYETSYKSSDSDLKACWNLQFNETFFDGFVNHFDKNPIKLIAKSIDENRFPHTTDLYLNSVPRLEQPRFSYKRASISFEIIVDEDYFTPQGLMASHYTIDPLPHSTRFHKMWKFVKKGFKAENPPKARALYCPVAHSGETDLFSYKYQSEPPYFTRYYGIKSRNITVHFPSNFEFTSEGRVETFYCLQDSEVVKPLDGDHIEKNPLPNFTYSIKMNACVSYTYFLTSAVRVWHLVLKPDEESAGGINELEIVKLMKFFSGSQEHQSDEQRQKVMRQIKFTVDDNEQSLAIINDKSCTKETDNLIKLLYDLTGIVYEKSPNRKMIRSQDEADPCVSLRNVRSGVVEIDTGSATSKSTGLRPGTEESLDNNNFLTFFNNPDAPTLSFDKRNEIREKVQELYKSLHDDDIKMGNEPKPFSVEEYADYVFKSYCGICLGIFDYDRMGLQEIDDTLVPLPDSKTEESFMVIHRGVLAMLGYGDDVMDTFWNTLGINAYLLIPSAVLAHNDFVSRDAEQRLNELLEDLRFDKSKLAISELLEERNVIDDLLNNDILGDVFQYKTEQELYKEGMQRRGIDQRIKDGRMKLEQLDKLITTMRDERHDRNQRFIQIFVTLFGLTSLYTPLRDLYVDEIGTNIEKQQTTIKWESHSLFNTLRDFSGSFYKKEWLFPENALAAAHHQILLILCMVLLYSIWSWASSPGSIIFKFWQRSIRNKRKLLNGRETR